MEDASKWRTTDRVIPTSETCAIEGRVRVVPLKAAWVLGHALAGAAGVVFFPQLDAFAVFVALSALTICAGHSVGMHRLLIHRSFKTPRWVEYLLVWLGTLVGMAGPFGMIRAHDIRDWHQRQTICPPHPSHQAGGWRDAWWQMCCEYRLDAPPQLVIEPEVAQDRLYRCLLYTSPSPRDRG